MIITSIRFYPCLMYKGKVGAYHADPHWQLHSNGSC